jgi:hypothetical protein
MMFIRPEWVDMSGMWGSAGSESVPGKWYIDHITIILLSIVSRLSWRAFVIIVDNMKVCTIPKTVACVDVFE